ncbi:MAG: hypothetical protein MUF18_13590 [Fimbriiglobus sp.]|nr:hypothetical protein [Fimbriiglobus sp.]
MERHQLEQVLQRVDPAVRLVNERHLRRGLRRIADLGHRVAFGLDHAHRLPVDWLQETDTFPNSVTDGDGTRRLLMIEPGDRISGRMSDADLLRVYWELLYEAAVVETVAGKGSDRWAELGEVATAEAVFRLRPGIVTPSDPTLAEQYAAFVGEFLTLRRFAPEVLAFTYPSIDAAVVERLAAKDLNAEELFVRTRPEGATEPGELATSPNLSEQWSATPDSTPEVLLDRANKAAATGNLVRAAVLRTRTGHPDAITAISEGLIPKLAKLFAWSRDERKAWADALTAVLPAAARGYWSPAAMGLYDLQKIPLDLTRELFAVDPASWVRSLFRRPLVRKLTLARHAVLLKHLRAARGHFARLSAALAEPILTPLDHEIVKADLELRAKLRPVVQGALAAHLAPHHLPEAVARDTIAEELIDTICHRGHARLADLRDSIARHALKLDDLAGPAEFVRGDALLRADAALGQSLDGLYHPGEAYLRAIQRGSSLAFGTTLGRWLTKFVVMPFGGAVMTVEFARYLWHEIGLLYGFLTRLIGDLDGPDPTPASEAVEHVGKKAHAELFTAPTVAAIVALGFFFLALLHIPPFRASIGRLLGRLGQVLKAVFVTAPLLVWNWAPVRAVRTHPVPRLFADRLGWPLLAGVAVAGSLWLFQANWPRVFAWGGGVFAFLAVLLNTPFGRVWQENVAEALSDWWRWVRRDLLPNLIGWMLWLFREAIATLDWFIYTVDEWLRFREGQSRPALVAKVTLALVWFPVAYLWRFAFYLLIEPQVNPVKHFPVVTVSHKLLLPMVGPIADTTGLGLGVVGAVIWGIPGIFGFIVWELKENWRLYAANRPRRLRPLAIGHHGETVYGLLTPGFHSGTVPAAFEKVRAALLRERHTGRVAKVRKPLDELHHAEESVRKLIDRELLALTRVSRAWAGLAATAGEVRLGLQRITAEVRFAGHDEKPTVIEFARLKGAIHGHVVARGVLDRLNTEQLAVWNQAVRGLLAKASAADGPEWAEWVGLWDRQSN